MLTILGPTATGKTTLAAHIAKMLDGEIISADSRQVYRGMTIGTGKDYDDYLVDGSRIPYHLIDIVDAGCEYNIYEYQKDFIKTYSDITGRGKLPFLCGGSGMYLEAVLRGYRLPEAESDGSFLASLEEKSMEQLTEILRSFKTLHNITDLEDRPRLLKAILIARGALQNSPATDPLSSIPHTASRIPSRQGGISASLRHTASGIPFPAINSTVFGISYPRGLIRQRIRNRLEQRIEQGMIEEVERLLAGGISPERMLKYGLEYKFVTLFLTGKLSGEELVNGLNIAIGQFAKRQMTWFRRMERQGIKIHWIDGRWSLLEKTFEVLKTWKVCNPVF